MRESVDEGCEREGGGWEEVRGQVGVEGCGGDAVGGVEEGERFCVRLLGGRWLWGEDGAGRAVSDCDCVVDFGQVVFGWEVGDCEFAWSAGGSVGWEGDGYERLFLVVRVVGRDDVDVVLVEEGP